MGILARVGFDKRVVKNVARKEGGDPSNYEAYNAANDCFRTKTIFRAFINAFRWLKWAA